MICDEGITGQVSLRERHLSFIKAVINPDAKHNYTFSMANTRSKTRDKSVNSALSLKDKLDGYSVLNLNDEGINLYLCSAEGAAELKKNGIAIGNVADLRDVKEESPTNRLLGIEKFLIELKKLDTKNDCIIHCEQGLNRTAIAATVLLVWKFGKTAEDATKLVQDALQVRYKASRGEDYNFAVPSVSRRAKTKTIPNSLSVFDDVLLELSKPSDEGALRGLFCKYGSDVAVYSGGSTTGMLGRLGASEPARIAMLDASSEITSPASSSSEEVGSEIVAPDVGVEAEPEGVRNRRGGK
jgi:hypothetical protein